MWWWLAGCGPTLVRRVEVVQERTQTAAVPAALVPLAATPPGVTTVLAGGALTAAPGAAGKHGQRVVPAQGVGRLGVPLGDRVELVVAGSGAPAGVAVPSLGLRGAGLPGFVGRATAGFRATVVGDGPVLVGLGADAGGVASVLRRVDTTTTSTWTASSTTLSRHRSVRPDLLQVHPELGVGFDLSAPLPIGARLELGLGARTWPRYWTLAEVTTVCSTWSDGRSGCESSGGWPRRPARLGATGTGAIGLAVPVDGLVVRAALLGQLAPGGGGSLLGGMVTLQR